MIRKFEPSHEILKPNYMPPRKPLKEKDSPLMSEEALMLYQSALQSMPKLTSGKSSSKMKRGGIVSSLGRPRTVASKSKLMQEEIE